MTKRRPRILRPAQQDGLMPTTAPDPEDSPVVAAFCDLVAEILLQALAPQEKAVINSAAEGTQPPHAATTQ